MRSLQHFCITTTISSSSARFQANANSQDCQALLLGAYKLLHFSHQTKSLESRLRFQTSLFRSSGYEQGLRLAATERAQLHNTPHEFSYLNPHHIFPNKMLCFHAETAEDVMSRLWFSGRIFMSFRPITKVGRSIGSEV